MVLHRIKKITVLLVFTFSIFVTGCVEDEDSQAINDPATLEGKKEYYDTGEVLAVYQEKNGVPDGKYKVFYKNGKLKFESRFTENRKDERGRIDYAYRGKDIYTAEYPKSFEKPEPDIYKKNNKLLNGKLTIFNDDKEKSFISFVSRFLHSDLNNDDTGELVTTGGVRRIAYFEKGLMVGKNSSFFDDGTKSSEYLYTRGLLNGEAQNWFHNGYRSNKANYKHGWPHGWDHTYGGVWDDELPEYKKINTKTNSTKYNEGVIVEEIDYINGMENEVTRYKDGEVVEVIKK